MIESDLLRIMFERQYFERQHNVLAIYPSYYMARDAFRLAYEDVRTQFPTLLDVKITDMHIQFPAGNCLRFMVINQDNDTEKVLGWQLVDYFVHESMQRKYFYDRLIAMLACRVRSK